MGIIAVTGHRPNKLNNEWDMKGPCSMWLSDQLSRILVQRRPEKLITGMALGFDLIAAWTAIGLNIKVTAALPFVGQERVWQPAQQAFYHWVLQHNLVTKHVVCEGGHSPGKFLIRNEWMVDQLDHFSDTLVAAWDGSEGGTAHCVKYAIEKDVTIDRLDPSIWRNVQ